MKRVWKFSLKRSAVLITILLLTVAGIFVAVRAKDFGMILKIPIAFWGVGQARIESEVAGESKHIDAEALESWMNQFEEVFASIRPGTSRASIAKAIKDDLINRSPATVIKETTEFLVVELYVTNDPCHALDVTDVVRPVAPLYASALQANLKLRERCQKIGPAPTLPLCNPPKFPEEKLMKTSSIARLFLETPSALACDL
jgi:hypothetical protein